MSTQFRYITYGSNTSYPVAVLIKSALVGSAPNLLKEYYTDKLVALGVPIEDIIIVGLPYDDFKKVSAKTLNTTVPDLQEYLDAVGALHVMVADGPYLKRMAKRQKLTNLAGVLLPSHTGSQRLFKGRSYVTYRFDDKAAERVQMGLEALVQSYKGTYRDKQIVIKAEYPKEPHEIWDALQRLLQYPVLECDIEGFGLGLTECGVATIAFCYDDGKAISFAVDYQHDHVQGKPNEKIRGYLKLFFEAYKGELWYHNISFDAKQLVANLFMKNDLLDYKNLVDGVEIMTKNSYCTKNLAYLATNASTGNELGLKHLSMEFAGSYALDVKNILIHPVQTILEYNVDDVICTRYVRQKYTPIMQARNQQDLFNRFSRNNRMLISMELTGMPLNMPKVLALRTKLTNMVDKLIHDMCAMECVEDYLDYKLTNKHSIYQMKVKGKGRTLTDFAEWKKDELGFKPTSNPAISWILHTHFELPVIAKSFTTKEPSVDDKTINKHLDWIEAGNGNPLAKPFLEMVQEYLKITKVLSTFVKPMVTKSILKKDGIYYLHGSFNQGSVKSGRLSSSDPKQLRADTYTYDENKQMIVRILLALIAMGFNGMSHCRNLPKRGNSYLVVIFCDIFKSYRKKITIRGQSRAKY